MNLDKLYSILRDTTAQARKGEVYQGTPAAVEWAKAGDADAPMPGGVLEVYAMSRANDPAFGGMEMVDCHFVKIAVDKAKAEAHRAELLALLNDWPNPEELAGGPSYITIGGAIGDQGAAFQLFALGQVLGLWTVITPATMGVEGAFADDMAGRGFIMCSGYRPAVGRECGS